MTLSSEERFRTMLPAVSYISLENEKALVAYLIKNKRLQIGETVTCIEKPGEGNMNCVLRVITNQRSFILKQSRPWVEKYPQIDAPIERLITEANYYDAISKSEMLKGMSPTYLWIDQKNYLMAMADLGDAADFTTLYQPGSEISSSNLAELGQYLSHLHRLPVYSSFPDNMAMRILNHEHIFRFPFEPDNGMNLDGITAGLSAAAIQIQHDTRLIGMITALGQRYLAKGTCLIHGDYYPGSWLKVNLGVKVIDPEFSFKGPPEFDLGVMIAHLMMAGQPPSTLDFSQFYKLPHPFSEQLVNSFAGVEIFRRLIGIAQLPLTIDLREKIHLMSIAKEWIFKGDLI